MMKIYRYGEVSNDEIFARPDMKTGVEDVVADIIANVRAKGDEALFEYCRKFDQADLDTLEVSEAEIDEAFDVVGDFRRVLERAAANIRKFHEKQLRNSFIINDEDGIIMGQKVIPMDKAGLYVPGGTAAYPSTVLMDAVPAKIAGVGELVITTPPGPDGKVNPYVLAAAKVAGVDRVLKVGGAQAIAALAYGTETVPKVDKIVGPGNAFVAEAKKQVYGVVSIDMIAGPSEVLCVADAKSDPRHVAADLLAQAEHDRNASAVLVTDSMDLAKQVAAEVDRQLETLPRTEIASVSIENNGKIIELHMDDPFDYLDAVRHAGSIFMGRNCPEPLGDYFAGPNHTLPTLGTARFSSPLSVDDFVKKTQYTYYTREALSRVYEDIADFADHEGLHGHARSIRSRFEDDPE